MKNKEATDMKLDIINPKKPVRVEKGDMIIYKNTLEGGYLHFMIIKDDESGEYCLLNLKINRIMKKVRAESIAQLVVKLGHVFNGEIYEVIPSEKLVMSRIKD
jgi:hypothetical protein